MSVVRKYQGGGKSGLSFKDYAIQNIKKEEFTPEALASFQSAVDKFDQLAKLDNLGEVFAIDPKEGKYTINVDKIKDTNLSNINWTGSSLPGKRNFFGRYNSRDIRGEEGSGESKYMGIVANLFGNYMKTFPSTTSTNVSKSYNLGDIQDYIKNKEFGGKDFDFDLLLSQNSEPEIQNKVVELVKNSLQDYITQSSKQGHNPQEYVDLQKAHDILNKVNNAQSFEDVRLAVLPLGWNLKEFLSSKPQDSPEVNKQDSFGEFLSSRNIPKHIYEDWYSKGWTSAKGNLPDYLTDVNLKEWFNSLGGITLSDDSGANIELLSPTGESLSNYKFDLSSPLYGTYLGKDNFGRLKHFRPGVEGYVNPDTDSVQGAGYRPIKGLVEGNTNWTILGVPEENEEGWSYTNRLLLQDKSGRKVEVVKAEDGTYRDKNNNPVDIKLQTFGEGVVEGEYFDVRKLLENDPFKDIKGREDNIENIVKEHEPLMREGFSRESYEKFKDLIGRLRYKLDSPSYLDREMAAGLYRQLLLDPKLAKDFYARTNEIGKLNRVANKANKIWGNKPSGMYYKGGIIKAQQGTKLSTKEESWQDYVNKISTSTKSGEGAPIKSWRGTLKDASGLEKAALASSVASILPGVGALGGLTSAGLNTIRKIKGEDVSAGEILLDLGFAGLGLVGLGGIGAAVKLGKSAKVASKAGQLDEAMKLTKESPKVLKKLGLLDNKIKIATESLEEISKTLSPETLKNSTFRSAVKKIAGKTGPIKNTGLTPEEIVILKEAGIFKKGANPSSLLSKNASETLKSLQQKEKALTRAIKAKDKFVKQIDDTVKKLESEKSLITTPEVPGWMGKKLSRVPDKAKNIAANTYGIGIVGLPGVLGATEVVKSVSEDGLANIKSSDLKQLAYTAAGTKRFLNNKKLASSIKSIVKTEPGKAKLQVRTKAYDTDLKAPEIVKTPNKVKQFLSSKAKTKTTSVEATNKEKWDTFAKEFKEKTGQDLPKNVSIKDIKNIKGEDTITGIVKASDSKLTPEQYERASRAIMGNTSNFSLPNFLKVIKGQEGIKLNWATYGKPKYLTAKDHIFTPAPTLPSVISNSNPLKKPSAFSNSVPREMWDLDPASYLQKIRNPTNTLTLTGKSINTPISNIPTKTQSGALGVDRKWDIKTLSGKVDPLAAINLAKLTASNLANKRIHRDLIKANEASYYANPIMPRINLNTQSTFNPLYENMASQNRMLGRNIAKSTDIDRGTVARLNAEKMANDVMIKGDLANQDTINKLRAAQNEMDYKVLLANSEAVTKNRANLAGIASKRSLIDAELRKDRAGQFDQYLSSVASGLEAKRLKKEQTEAREKYFSLVTDPEYKKLYEEYNTNYSEEALANLKKQFEDANKTNLYKPKWEGSEQEVKWKSNKEALAKRIQLAEEVLQAGLLRHRLGLFAKGGNISEKIKSRDRALLARAKYYESILRNTGQVRSSLLSLFK